MHLLIVAAAAELPPNRDYITTGGLIICALLSAFSAVIVALLQSNRNLTKRGVVAAESAADRSEPTGNGWAKEVKEALKRIEAEQAEQGRDIGGIREEQRNRTPGARRAGARAQQAHREERPMTTFRGFKACTCLAAWLPVYEAELLRRKILKPGQKLKIYQLIGGAAASGGTHATGGAADLLDLPGNEDWSVARQMGADASWSRPKNWDGRGGMAHFHLVLRGCPHNRPARYQYTSTTQGVDHGHNGLANYGKDNGPRPLSYRTWSQGITWAKKQGKPEAVLRPMQFNLPDAAKIANPAVRVARAVQVIATAKPHLIGWNELVGTPKPGYASAFASSVDKALGANWSLVRPTTPFNENYISYDSTVLQLLEQYDDTILPSKSGGRHLTRAVFKHKATGKVFAVGQTHLVNDTTRMTAKQKKQAQADRQTQAKGCLSSMKAVSAKHDQCPFIIQGDANTPAALTALANGGMKNTRQFADTSGNRNATTYTNKDKAKPSTDPAWILDQQYVTAGMYVVGYTVHQDLDAKGNFVKPRPSDHQPIISSVRF